ncbi:formylglycine-generating enzyme family protein, partial [Gammaproteobacteria bacterium]|nr:formylglycine-generating enzyme family protein [Gammaproteobacteria bacterium]
MASGKGKKGAVNEPQKTDPFLAQNLDYQAPGRAVGLTVMLSLVAFTAAFMSYQSLQLDEATSPSSKTSEASENFALPGDPLWGFVSIPAGEFIMGSNPQRDRMAYENERWSSTQRQGRVALPDYFIGRFEVTNAQFAHYLSAIGSSSAEAFAELDPALPVTSVSLPQTLSYARWLDSQLRSTAATPVALREALDAGAKVTLPSEAEWEKAARGTDGRIFPWGMEPNGAFANVASAALLLVGSRGCESC